jgi:tetratricopeptide (TPR) repeat protein
MQWWRRLLFIVGAGVLLQGERVDGGAGGVPVTTNEQQASMQLYRDGLGLQPTNLVAAVEKYELALRRDGCNWEALNHYAWFLGVTAPTAYRNTERALGLALRAAEVTGWHNKDVIDTVAEVYFQRGEIGKAIELEKKALLPGLVGKSKEKYLKGQLDRFTGTPVGRQ